jgi:hypothetical protein
MTWQEKTIVDVSPLSLASIPLSAMASILTTSSNHLQGIFGV